MSHRSRKFANCFEQPFSFSFSTTSPPESSGVHETRVVKVHEAVDRSSRTAVDPIEIRAQKRRSDFSDVKRDCLCHIFEKDGKTRSSIGCLRGRHDEFLKLIYDS